VSARSTIRLDHRPASVLKGPLQSRHHLLAGPLGAVRDGGRLDDDVRPVGHRFGKDAEIAQLILYCRSFRPNRRTAYPSEERVHPRQFALKVSEAIRGRLPKQRHRGLLKPRSLRATGNQRRLRTFGVWERRAGPALGVRARVSPEKAKILRRTLAAAADGRYNISGHPAHFVSRWL